MFWHGVVGDSPPRRLRPPRGVGVDRPARGRVPPRRQPRPGGAGGARLRVGPSPHAGGAGLDADAARAAGLHRPRDGLAGRMARTAFPRGRGPHPSRRPRGDATALNRTAARTPGAALNPRRRPGGRSTCRCCPAAWGNSSRSFGPRWAGRWRSAEQSSLEQESPSPLPPGPAQAPRMHAPAMAAITPHAILQNMGSLSVTRGGMGAARQWAAVFRYSP